MKITPLEIRQQDFEKKLRGYDKDEVNAFLLSLSNEWERLLDENKELSIKLKQAEKEVDKLREVEGSLFQTLKTAEQTGANVIDQANKAAELHMKETKMNAEALLNESKSRAQATVEQAEIEARNIIEELQEAVRSIEQNYQQLESNRQNVLQEMKNLSVSLIEKVELSSKERQNFNFEDYVKRVKALAKQSEQHINAGTTEINELADKLGATPLNLDEVVEEAKKEEPALQPPVPQVREMKIEQPAQTLPKEEPAQEPKPEPVIMPEVKVEEPPTPKAEPSAAPLKHEEPIKPAVVPEPARVLEVKVEKEQEIKEEAIPEVKEAKANVDTLARKKKSEEELKEGNSLTKSFFDELDLD